MKLFISYRRDDSSGYVNHLYDLLCEHFPADEIFRDVRAIEPGEDFVEVIENAVAECEVLLAVIGKHWLTLLDGKGKRRLDNPNDFVRIEIATALECNIRVIPLLVGRATMPITEDLPDDLQKLARRNALELSDKNFKQDVAELVTVLKRILDRPSVKVEPVFIDENPSILIKNAPTAVRPPKMRIRRIDETLPPPFAWCVIPAGKVKLEAGGHVPKSGQVFDVHPFAIAKYPITNAQFQIFVDADYNSAAWWEYAPAAKAWRQNHRVEARNSYAGDDPCTDVCWFEAVAFSLWLSNKTGLNLTLPTEQQWQYAAQGNDGRNYPWGNTFDGDRCNTLENKAREKSSVTKYEGKGNSPFGVLDMAGNVWDWCLTDHRTGNQDISKVGHGYVVRGGSFGNFKEDSLVSHRLFVTPDQRTGNVGFRLVMATAQ